jgi:hypothetical protein
VRALLLRDQTPALTYERVAVLVDSPLYCKVEHLLQRLRKSRPCLTSDVLGAEIREQPAQAFDESLGSERTTETGAAAVSEVAAETSEPRSDMAR